MVVVKTVLVPLSRMVLSLVRLPMPLLVVRLVVHSDAWAVVTVWKHVNLMLFTLIRKQVCRKWMIIEIRPKGKNNRRMVVMCVNKDKGAIANKACKASCIGCGICVKVCPFEAITLENNLAYIDPAKCKSCRKC